LLSHVKRNQPTNFMVAAGCRKITREASREIVKSSAVVLSRLFPKPHFRE
jgi:hypothetical protein